MARKAPSPSRPRIVALSTLTPAQCRLVAALLAAQEAAAKAKEAAA